MTAMSTAKVHMQLGFVVSGTVRAKLRAAAEAHGIGYKERKVSGILFQNWTMTFSTFDDTLLVRFVEMITTKMDDLHENLQDKVSE